MVGLDGRAPGPSFGLNAPLQQGRFNQYGDINFYNSFSSSTEGYSLPMGFQTSDTPDSTVGMHDPVSAHIHLKIKEKTWRGELLEKWPSKAEEYLKRMHNIRLASSRSSNNGWVIYDEQPRLKKGSLSLVVMGLIDQELWILYVATNNASSVNNASHIRGLNLQTWNGNPRQFNSSFNSGQKLPSRGNPLFRAEGFQMPRHICFRFNQERCTFGKNANLSINAQNATDEHSAVRCKN